MENRPPTKDDLPALLILYRHLHSTDDPLPSPSVIEAVWSEIMSNEQFQYFGGFVDSELVSSCNLTIIPDLTRGCRPPVRLEQAIRGSAIRCFVYLESRLIGAGRALSDGTVHAAVYDVVVLPEFDRLLLLIGLVWNCGV